MRRTPACWRATESPAWLSYRPSWTRRIHGTRRRRSDVRFRGLRVRDACDARALEETRARGIIGGNIQRQKVEQSPLRAGPFVRRLHVAAEFNASLPVATNLHGGKKKRADVGGGPVFFFTPREDHAPGVR